MSVAQRLMTFLTILCVGLGLIGCGVALPEPAKTPEAPVVPRAPVGKDARPTPPRSTPGKVEPPPVQPPPPVQKYNPKLPLVRIKPVVKRWNGPKGIHVLPRRNTWAQRIGQDVIPGGVATASHRADDAIYVVGHFRAQIDVLGKRLKSAGGTDGFVAKIDLQGSLVWLQSFGGSGNDAALDITRGCAGRYFVVGRFEKSLKVAGKSLAPQNKSDGLLLEFSPATGKWLDANAGGIQTPGEFFRVAAVGVGCSLAVVVHANPFYAYGGRESVQLIDVTSRGISRKWSYECDGVVIQNLSSDALGNIVFSARPRGLVHLGGEKLDLSGELVVSLSLLGKRNWFQHVEFYRGRLLTKDVLFVDAQSGRIVLAGMVSYGGFAIDKKKYAGSAYVVSFDKYGKSQWVYSSEHTFEPLALRVTSNETHMIARFQRSLRGFGTIRLAASNDAMQGRFMGTFDRQGKPIRAAYLTSPGNRTLPSQEPQHIDFQVAKDGRFILLYQFADLSPWARSTHANKESKGAFYVLQVNGSGQLDLYARSGTGNSEVFLRDAATDAKGNVYRLVSFQGVVKIGQKRISTGGKWRHVLIKQDAEGRLLWSRQFWSDQGNSLRLAVGPDGSVTASGMYEYSAAFQGKPIQVGYGIYAYLVRWSADGTFLVRRTIKADGHGRSGSGIRNITSLVHAPNGKIFVAYYHLNERYRILQLDGLLEVQKTYIIGHLSYGLGLVVDGQSNVYVMGRSFEFNNVKNKELRFGDLRLPPQNGGFVAKLSASGTFTWAKVFPKISLSTQGIVDAKGRLVLTGSTLGNTSLGAHSITKPEGSVSEGFLVQFDGNGKILWAREFHRYGIHAGNYYNLPFRLQHGPDQSFFLSGSVREFDSIVIDGKKSDMRHVYAQIGSTGKLMRIGVADWMASRLFYRDGVLQLVGSLDGEQFRVGKLSFSLSGINWDVHAKATLAQLLPSVP